MAVLRTFRTEDTGRSENELDLPNFAAVEPELSTEDDDDQRPRDPLGDAASAVFDDLASGNLDKLEHRSAPYQHRRRIRLLMHAAGRDPRCTPRSDAGMCTAVVASLLFTGGWQLVAVVIAARYDLGFTTQPFVLALTAIVVALAVVMFDWTIIQSHVQGGVGRKTWLTRTLFTLCMILLVSEVVASAVFDNDIRAQLIADNAVKEGELDRKQDDIRIRQEDERTSIRDLEREVTDAQLQVQRLKNELESEENGYDTAAGRGPRWHEADLKLREAEQTLSAAVAARDDPNSGVPAHKKKIDELQSQADGLGRTTGVVDYDQLGPAQREALLWKYLFEHPSALIFKRIPLFVILVCLDLFALLIGLAVSPRTREMHDGWATEQREWALAARFVRGRVLQDAKRMIGRLVIDGVMGSAEQRARRARQLRKYQADEKAVHDSREHQIRMQAAATSDDPEDDPFGDTAEEPSPHVAARHIPSPRDTGETGADGPSRVRERLGPVEGVIGGTEVDRLRMGAGGSAATQELGTGQPVTSNPIRTEPVPADHYRVRLPDDPAEQSDEDLAPFINRWYETDDQPIRALGRLDTEGSRSSRRATLLLGTDTRDRYHVIKLFSVSGADGFANNDLSRDAGNAQRMTRFSGGLDRQARGEESWLAPGFFGTQSIADYPDVPYLVMPYYPSGSVKEYLKQYRGQLTLDWCLRLSERMFRACARLAEAHVVSCDAKLSNFVFAQGAYAPSLSKEDRAVIDPEPDHEGESPDPAVHMIDLSMVYLRGQHEERPTRGMRGTEHWSSPRAMSGREDDLPHELTNLDDAFTIAINSIYLLTGKEPPYPLGYRVALEELGGGNLRDEDALIELGELLARLADTRVMGPGADDMLVAGRRWLTSEGADEEHACAVAADTIRRIRGALDADLVLHAPFRDLGFVPTDADFAKAS